MTTTDELTTVRQQIIVDVAQDHAFAVFTNRFDGIKPREYNLLPVDIAETVFEPRVGGHVYDRGIDGSVCRWARVLEFDPPHRFLISWDITAQWQLETDLGRTSEVEVRFVPIGDAQTRVELEHRHLDRHGEGWRDYRSGLAGGWPAFLENFRVLTTAQG
ncbi:SRPBCC family protein [Pseudonocardia parietis]|uniref:Uncharacterized protein YndB with AHSA1/START domain n=1 Tax=Pseudonocardia parietis TaxID=570936 RepID=A0ABS4VRE6_9PSEU|nr:SRPBCC family protein [Pseudonocardia parietis]MBP2366508.1 uncharacterized protein YndB with AHSA1/START domain [Pseudonocardia parietis]